MTQTTRITVADYLAQAIDLSGKTQREIAAEVGYPKPNVVSMMKTGETKVPLDKIPAFAAACRIDPIFFLRLALAEYHPEIWAVMRDTIGVPLTANEWDLVITYQLVAPMDEIEMTPARTFEVMAALREDPQL